MDTQKPIDNKLDVMADVFMNVTEDGHLEDPKPEQTLVETLADEAEEVLLDKVEKDEDDLSIQEQLRGEDPSGDTEEIEVSPGDIEVDFELLSKMTKLPKEDLYKIPIPLGDEREPIQLGKLKDQYVEAERFRDKQQEMTEALADQQNELMAKRREVDSLVQALGPHLDPSTQNYINEQSQQSIARERKLVVQSIPEWSDPKAVASDIEAITDFTSAYGYSPVEINNIVDHRLFKMLRDVALGHKRVKEARKMKAPPKHDAPRRSVSGVKVNVNDLVKRAQQSGSAKHKGEAMLAVIGASNVNE